MKTAKKHINAAKLFLASFALLLCLGCIRGAAQTTIAIDPALTGAVIAGNSMERRKMRDIENLKDKINNAQIATTAVLAKIDNIQNKLYKGLSQVSSAVNNLYQIKYCYDATKSILEYEGLMLAEARKNPIALAWAYKSQKFMYERAMVAYAQIAAFILKSGRDAMMDAGARTQLIYNIYSELQILESYAISSYFSVKRVVQVGVVQSLNPFKDYMDLDKRAVREILERVKF